MEQHSRHRLKQIILSITKKTDAGFKCNAVQSCNYTQSPSGFKAKNFAWHIKKSHVSVYNALLPGLLEGKYRRNVMPSSNKKMTLKNKILSITRHTEKGFVCTLGENCNYTQALDKLTPANFSRHVLALHPDDYKRLELGTIDPDQRLLQKPTDPCTALIMAKVNRFRFMCGIIRLVTTHGLPFNCVSWQGIQDIIGPQMVAFRMPIDESRMQLFVTKTANRMRRIICEDMNGRMVALQLHGVMGKGGQYLVRVTCSYMKDCQISKQTLGVIVLDETSTAIDLEDKVNRIKERCGLDQWQIYTMSIDYGRINLKPDAVENQESMQHKEVDDSKFIEILGQYNASLNDVNVLQCGRHLLSMVATEVTQEWGEVIEEIIEMVKNFRQDEYKLYLQTWHGRCPPVPDKNNYGFGTYLMMKVLKEDRSFYEQFTTHYPGFALYLHWDFIDEFVTAFEPLYNCALSIENCGLSDFHLQWLLAYGKIRCLGINRFRMSLLKNMETRQKQLEELTPYKAALYMDPRLNFRGSKLFDHSKKEKIITFLQSIYTMTNDSPGNYSKNSPTPSSSTSTQSPGDFSMNAYLTEMLGEGSPESVMEDLIREIQHQERCDADDKSFDIIRYWAQKKMHDSRLWTLAMAVFAPLATHCDSDDDLGQTMAGFSDCQSLPADNGDDEDILPTEEDTSTAQAGEAALNALFVKQNSNLLEKAVSAVFFKGRQYEKYEMESDV